MSTGRLAVWILPFTSYYTCFISFVCTALTSHQSTYLFFGCLAELITDITVFPLNTCACNQSSIFVYRFFFLRGKICLHWHTRVHLLSFDECIHLGTLNNFQDTQQHHHPKVLSCPFPAPPYTLHCPNALCSYVIPP